MQRLFTLLMMKSSTVGLKLLHLTKKDPNTSHASWPPPPFSTAKNGRMLCHYIQKQDNLKLNGCPLQCPQVQPHSVCPELRPFQKASSPQPQQQAKSIKSLFWLFCSFYKLYTCTVGNSGFLANNHIVNTTLQIKKRKYQEHLQMPCHTNSKVHRVRRAWEPFHFKNVWKYVQLWYSFRVLQTPNTTSCEPLTISRALWKTTYDHDPIV